MLLYLQMLSFLLCVYVNVCMFLRSFGFKSSVYFILNKIEGTVQLFVLLGYFPGCLKLS